MQYIKSITLDVYNDRGKRVTVFAKQGDTARGLKVTLTANGAKITPEDGTTAAFRVRKGDGHSVDYPVTIEPDGTIMVPLSAQAVAWAGRCFADVYLLHDGVVLSNAVFDLFVEAAPTGDGIPSSDEYGVMLDATQAAKDAAGEARTAAGQVTGALQELAELETGVSAAEQARREAEKTRKEEHTAAMEAAGTATARANTAAAAIEGITVEATPVGPGGSPTAGVQDVDGHMHVTFGIPEGEQGKPGVSPTVTVEKVGKKTTITITDAKGTHTVEVFDGEDGAGQVSSVNGQTGEVNLTAEDVGACTPDEVDAKIAAAAPRSWSITVPHAGWGASTATWTEAGLTAKWETTVEAEGMTADVEIRSGGISFDGGSLDAAGQWDWLSTGEGSVTLYSARDVAPAADFGLILTEVIRNGST